MLSIDTYDEWENRTSLGREVVLAERRTIYEWRIEDGSGEVFTVSIVGGMLMCSCAASCCIHESVVRCMMGVT